MIRGKLIDVGIVIEGITPIYQQGKKNKLLIRGPTKTKYEIELVNKSDLEILTVVAVDEINVIDNSDDHVTGAGHILGPRSSLIIDGYRRYLEEAEPFYFPEQIGSPGTIKMVVFNRIKDTFARHVRKPREILVVQILPHSI